jgi:hypothetical protein
MVGLMAFLYHKPIVTQAGVLLVLQCFRSVMVACVKYGLSRQRVGLFEAESCNCHISLIACTFKTKT